MNKKIRNIILVVVLVFIICVAVETYDFEETVDAISGSTPTNDVMDAITGATDDDDNDDDDDDDDGDDD
jgi:hypothetical protein